MSEQTHSSLETGARKQRMLKAKEKPSVLTLEEVLLCNVTVLLLLPVLRRRPCGRSTRGS